MSIQNLSQADILGYKETTLNILKQQIDILQKAEQRILPKRADLEDDKAKESVLTIEKSGELQQILNNEIAKLQNFDVVLAVVGTMKAGKSTTINAIVGREILPNRNRPMTALPTLICHNPAKQIPSISIDPTVLNDFLTKLFDKLPLVPKSEKMPKEMPQLIDFIANGGQFKDYYEGEENIFEFLYQLNDLVRLSKDVSNAQIEQGDEDILHFPFDDYKNFANLPMIEVAFKLDSDFDTQGRFMLLDTAGPNEAGQDELKEALTEQLERSSAVMIVLDYTQLNSDAEKDVKEQIEKIPTVQKSRLFALVNKFDQKNANSDEADATRKHIFNNLLKDKIELDNIYAISAQDAYLANRMKSYIEKHGDKPEYQPETWIEDFAKKLFGEMAEMIYPTANVDMIKQGLNKIVERSCMAEPMQNVIVNMQMNAPFIAIQSALAGAGDVFNRLHNTLNIRDVFAKKENLTEKEIAELRQKIEELKADAFSVEQKKNELRQRISQIQESIHQRINVQDKIKIINLETESAIAKMFDANSAMLKRTLSEVEANNLGLRGFLGKLVLKSEKQVAKEKARLDELRDKAKSDGNHLIFSNETDLNNFQQQASHAVNQFVQNNVIETFDDILQDSLMAVQEIMQEINKEAEHLSDLLREKFKVNGFDLRIEFDATANLDKNMSRIANIKLNANKKTHSETRKETGFMGGTKRFFGGVFGKSWGTYTVNYTTYTISKQETVAQFLDIVNEQCIKPLQSQVDDKVQELLDNGMDYIDTFGRKADEIIYEIQRGLEHQQIRVNQSKSEKEYEKQFISSLRQSHDDLDKDWQKIKEVFKVEDIKS